MSKASLLAKFQTFVKEKEAEKTKDFQPNEKQQQAIDLAFTDQDFCFIGSAGTGKTSTFKFLLQNSSKSFEALGIYFVAPTNKAAGNLRRQLPYCLQHRVSTIHKFLEYVPVFYEKLTPQGDIIKTRVFEPRRTKNNPILEAKIVVIEESGMVGIDPLFLNLQAACPRAKFIFMGDLNQLPTIYGHSILVEKLSSLPVVELTKPYRQALNSPIIRLAHGILEGKPLSSQVLKEKFEAATPEGSVKFTFFSKKISADNALTVIGNHFRKMILEERFQQEKDLILIPFNKQFGSIELGKIVSQAFADLRKQEVWEIIAGFQKLYLYPGDLILFNKENYRILEIRKNPAYAGITSVEPSKRKNQASHILTLKNTTSEEEIEVQTVGEIMGIISADVITVHKAQGSEADNVHLIIHNSHYKGSVLCRELLYTGITRARNSLNLICEKDTFELGIGRQRVKGNTLDEKIANYIKQTNLKIGD